MNSLAKTLKKQLFSVILLASIAGVSLQHAWAMNNPNTNPSIIDEKDFKVITLTEIEELSLDQKKLTTELNTYKSLKTEAKSIEHTWENTKNKVLENQKGMLKADVYTEIEKDYKEAANKMNNQTNADLLKKCLDAISENKNIYEMKKNKVKVDEAVLQKIGSYAMAYVKNNPNTFPAVAKLKKLSMSSQQAQIEIKRLTPLEANASKALKIAQSQEVLKKVAPTSEITIKPLLTVTPTSPTYILDETGVSNFLNNFELKTKQKTNFADTGLEDFSIWASNIKTELEKFNSAGISAQNSFGIKKNHVYTGELNLEEEGRFDGGHIKDSGFVCAVKDPTNGIELGYWNVLMKKPIAQTQETKYKISTVFPDTKTTESLIEFFIEKINQSPYKEKIIEESGKEFGLKDKYHMAFTNKFQENKPNNKIFCFETFLRKFNHMRQIVSFFPLFVIPGVTAIVEDVLNTNDIVVTIKADDSSLNTTFDVPTSFLSRGIKNIDLTHSSGDQSQEPTYLKNVTSITIDKNIEDKNRKTLEAEIAIAFKENTGAYPSKQELKAVSIKKTGLQKASIIWIINLGDTKPNLDENELLLELGESRCLHVIDKRLIKPAHILK